MALRLRGLLVAGIAALSLVGAPVALAAAPTVVSLTFDDSLATQTVVPSMLAAHSMQGTFFVNSGHIGTPGFLSWGQVASVAAAGNEIAGHTVDHFDLEASTTDVHYQVCEDRARLLKHGFSVSDFAYPYGSGWRDDTVRSVIAGCGYNSARGAWGLIGPSCQPPNCWDYAESIPPQDAFAVRTADNPQQNTPLSTIESYVTNAQNNGGGWVILVFHAICDGCQQYSTPQPELQAFLDWLQLQSGQGTTVRTLADVIGGSVQPSPGTQDTTPPTSTIACNGAPCSSSLYQAPVSVSLSGQDSGGSGLDAVRYTTDGSTPTLTSSVYSGPFTVSTTTTVTYAAWDNAGNLETSNSQQIQLAGPDQTPPSTTISCNGSGCSTGAYPGPVQVALTATDADSGVAAIRYTTDGSDPTTSSPLYTTPFTVTATSTVKYRAWDNAGNLEPTNSQQIQVATTPPGSPAPSGGGGGGGSSSLGLRVAPSAQTVASGEAASWTVSVTNTGGAYLYAVGIKDALVPGCRIPSAYADAASFMAPGVTITFACSLNGVTASLVNTVVATATTGPGDVITATATASVTVQTSAPPAAPFAPPLLPGAPRATAAATQFATITISRLKTIVLHGKRPALTFTIRASKATNLALALADPHGHVVARWHKHAKRGKNVFSLPLPARARHPGHDRLRITVAGKPSPKSFGVTLAP